MAVDVALGILHHEYLDVAVPGTITLSWERQYTTALARSAPTPLGVGWTSEYFATLTRAGNGFELATGSGIVRFENFDSVPPGGRVARNLSACAELLVLPAMATTRVNPSLKKERVTSPATDSMWLSKVLPFWVMMW